MKKYLISCFVIAMACLPSSAQNNNASPASIKVTELTASQVPTGIKYRGQLSFCRQWTDALGENYLVGSTGNAVLTLKAKDNPVTSEDAYSKYLFASHFIKTDTGYKLLWKLEDGTKHCSFDITAAFLSKSIQVADLNKNGIAETTVIYRLSCRSDVSPSEMKLIMHEGDKKYALRGLMALPASEEEQKKMALIKEFNLEKVKLPSSKDENYYWEQQGRYINEKDFAGAPALLTFARSQWRRFFDESKVIGE